MLGLIGNGACCFGQAAVLIFELLTCLKCSPFDVGWSIQGVFIKGSLMTLIRSSDVVVSSIKLILSCCGVKMLDSYVGTLLSGKCEPHYFLRAHSLIDIQSKGFKEKIFRGLAN